MQVSFLRHSGFFGPEDVNGKTLNIIGVGATGSWVGLIAAKMGWHNFRVWDLDIVESHNLPNQIYSAKHIGMKKVDAFEQVLKEFNPQVQVQKYYRFYTNQEDISKMDFGSYMFIAVDSLSARKDIIEGVKNNLFLELVAESQMGFTHATINYFEPNDYLQLDTYKSMLKDDSEVTESACNERIITTLTAMVASEIVQTISAHASKSRRTDGYKRPHKQIFSLNPLKVITF